MTTKRVLPAALAGALAAALLAWATFSPGDNLVAPVVEPIPTGVVVGWSGSVESIPAGWHLCDGTRGTPDLRGRFILGASTADDEAEAGGQNAYTTTENEQHDVKITRGGGFAALDPVGSSTAVNKVRTHRHTVEVLPPYYRLAFIMKLRDE
ncbi:MAG: hypothetical protein QNK18_09335 [Gammaproteobacteria bacterium]|nr:hypothetical protein [Gammaproteobacteria bacterium]